MKPVVPGTSLLEASESSAVRSGEAALCPEAAGQSRSFPLHGLRMVLGGFKTCQSAMQSIDTVVWFASECFVHTMAFSLVLCLPVSYVVKQCPFFSLRTVLHPL